MHINFDSPTYNYIVNSLKAKVIAAILSVLYF